MTYTAEQLREMPLKHTCHRRGCGIDVPPEMFACKRHWFQLPKHIRDGIKAAYRVGQCQMNPPPSKIWLYWARQAKEFFRTRCEEAERKRHE